MNPLEGLMSVAVSRQPISSCATAPASSQPPAAPLCAHRQGRGSRREPRKRLTSLSVQSSVAPACSLQQVQAGRGCGSSAGPACALGRLHARALRVQHSPENAARERSRVRNLRQAFHSLQAALPSVPPDTKLSKLDVLVLATNYIAYLTETLHHGETQAEAALPSRPGGYLHPVKKWPMRSLLYCGSVGDLLSGGTATQTPPAGQERIPPHASTSPP